MRTREDKLEAVDKQALCVDLGTGLVQRLVFIPREGTRRGETVVDRLRPVC